MLRKDIKAFIVAIRKHDTASFEALLSSLPELVSATAKSPPKKDDGQSPLQIAFNVGNFGAAEALIEAGADCNFIEQSDINEWRAPVLHDAIRATIFSCRTLNSESSQFEAGKALISKCLEFGADPSAEDSYGNNCLMRATLDARQMIMHPGFEGKDKAVLGQIREVFAILLASGADPSLATSSRESVMDAQDNLGLSAYNLAPNK